VSLIDHVDPCGMVTKVVSINFILFSTLPLCQRCTTCSRILKQNKRKARKSVDTMHNNLDGDKDGGK